MRWDHLLGKKLNQSQNTVNSCPLHPGAMRMEPG
jgi:hypothetical protein